MLLGGVWRRQPRSRHDAADHVSRDHSGIGRTASADHLGVAHANPNRQLVTDRNRDVVRNRSRGPVIAVDDQSNYPPQVLDKPHDLSGFQPNVEAIAALQARSGLDRR